MHFRGLVCPLPMWEVVLGVGNAFPMRDWPFPCLEVRSSLLTSSILLTLGIAQTSLALLSLNRKIRSSLVANLNSHTALSSEGGGYGRKDGDEDVEDFSPGGVVVESSQSVSWLFLKVRH